jgi:hypothetical protein
MQQKGMTRQTLVAALGYTNATKGLRKVDAVIRGEETGEMLDRVCMVLGIDRYEIDAATAATREKLVRERVDSIMPRIRR